MRWALINTETNLVENVIIWDGEGSLFPNTLNVLLTENEPCSIGWLYEANNTPRFTEQPE
jgi:hypothetical protein